MSRGGRVTINGVQLRHGRTFVGRVLPRRSLGASGRFTTMACVSVDTSSAIVAAINPSFAATARRDRRKTKEFYEALARLEQSRNRPGWTPAEAAVEIAQLVLVHRDALNAQSRPVKEMWNVKIDAMEIQQPFSVEPWHVEIGELSMSAADINSGW
jgi:hypothetical protein